KEIDLAIKAPGGDTLSLFRMYAAVTHLGVSGIRFGMNPKMERTPSSGLRTCPTPTAASACSAGRMLGHADACGDRPSPAPGRYLPHVHAQQLSQWLGVFGRRVPAVVQRDVDLNTGARHRGPLPQDSGASGAGCPDRPLTDYPLFPLSDKFVPKRLSVQFAPYFLDWLAHPSFDGYWRPWSIEDHYRDMNVPALTAAACYDIFLGGSLRNYLGDATKQRQLLVTIGGHAGSRRKIGDVD